MADSSLVLENISTLLEQKFIGEEALPALITRYQKNSEPSFLALLGKLINRIDLTLLADHANPPIKDLLTLLASPAANIAVYLPYKQKIKEYLLSLPANQETLDLLKESIKPDTNLAKLCFTPTGTGRKASLVSLLSRKEGAETTTMMAYEITQRIAVIESTLNPSPSVTPVVDAIGTPISSISPQVEAPPEGFGIQLNDFNPESKMT